MCQQLLSHIKANALLFSAVMCNYQQFKYSSCVMELGKRTETIAVLEPSRCHVTAAGTHVRQPLSEA